MKGSMVEHETCEDIALLRLAHGKVNAFDLELLEQISEKLDNLETSTYRALIITGSGETFSAGVDLFRVLEGGESYLKQFLPALTRALVGVYTFPRPVIAAINGHAIAGGCVLACACDYRLMAMGKGMIGVPEVVVDLPFPLIALEILRDVLPACYFQEVLSRGLIYPAENALERGIIDELIDPTKLIDEAYMLAKNFADIPAETFRLTKKQLRRHVMERWEREHHQLDRKVLRAWASSLVQELIRDYLERTLGRSK